MLDFVRLGLSKNDLFAPLTLKRVLLQNRKLNFSIVAQLPSSSKIW